MSSITLSSVKQTVQNAAHTVQNKTIEIYHSSTVQNAGHFISTKVSSAWASIKGVIISLYNKLVGQCQQTSETPVNPALIATAQPVVATPAQPEVPAQGPPGGPAHPAEPVVMQARIDVNQPQEIPVPPPAPAAQAEQAPAPAAARPAHVMNAGLLGQIHQAGGRDRAAAMRALEERQAEARQAHVGHAIQAQAHADQPLAAPAVVPQANAPRAAHHARQPIAGPAAGIPVGDDLARAIARRRSLPGHL